jgi:hypothetical protein
VTEDPPALLPCPFCGAGETISEPDSKHWTGMRTDILSWHIRHWCDYPQYAPTLNVRGRTETESVERWNRRVP